jgi:hypothetical protein
MVQIGCNARFPLAHRSFHQAWQHPSTLFIALHPLHIYHIRKISYQLSGTRCNARQRAFQSTSSCHPRREHKRDLKMVIPQQSLPPIPPFRSLPPALYIAPSSFSVNDVLSYARGCPRFLRAIVSFAISSRLFRDSGS